MPYIPTVGFNISQSCLRLPVMCILSKICLKYLEKFPGKRLLAISFKTTWLIM